MADENNQDEIDPNAETQEIEMGLAGMSYADAGVSIMAQNKVNAQIKDELTRLGLKVEGLFGGALDISHLKGSEQVNIGIVCASLVEGENEADAGIKTAEAALEKIASEAEPLAMLDYYASAEMGESVISFVRGIAATGLTKMGVPTIGGESAQMPGTYKEGKRDAYAHILFNGVEGDTVDIAARIKEMEKPLLCASTDGTGTKTRIVRNPKDIIYHGLNDLGAMGVKPFGFALYVAGNAPQEELEEIVAKAQEICDTLGITALNVTVEQKIDEYEEGQVDIAGTVVGVIDEKDLIKGEGVKEEDVVVGFAADGLMTNGYSLARKYCDTTSDDWDTGIATMDDLTIREELSKPHVPYTDILFGNSEAEGILAKFGDKIKATAHITGGGQKDNIERMVPDGLCAEVKRLALPLPPIVQYFASNMADMDAMEEAFNMGVGFTVTVSADSADEVVKYVNANFKDSVQGVERKAAFLGKITASKDGEKFRYAA